MSGPRYGMAVDTRTCVGCRKACPAPELVRSRAFTVAQSSSNAQITLVQMLP